MSDEIRKAFLEYVKQLDGDIPPEEGFFIAGYKASFSRIKELEEALESCLEHLEMYYPMLPNAHRKSFEDYFADEIKAIHKDGGEG